MAKLDWFWGALLGIVAAGALGAVIGTLLVLYDVV